MKLDKTRRRQSAVEMICGMLKISDKQLNAYIDNGELPSEAPKKVDNLAKARAAKAEKNKK